jgi:hypothetical protein
MPNDSHGSELIWFGAAVCYTSISVCHTDIRALINISISIVGG